MGVYDFTLTVGADDSAANQVLELLNKNLIKATKKENVISLTADATNVEKTLKELVELNPTIGTNIELVIDQSKINKELEFLSGILNSKTNLDADQIVSKFKSSFTSGIKKLGLGDILANEVGNKTRSIENVQKAINGIVERIDGIDITDSLDMKQMTTYLEDLETANALLAALSKDKKLGNSTKIDTSALQSILDSVNLDSVYKQLGQNIFMNQEEILKNLEQESINIVKDFQTKLADILQHGVGYEIVSSEELEKEKAKLAEMEQAFALTQKSSKELINEMAAVTASIEDAFDEDDAEEVEKLQKQLWLLAEAYNQITGKDLSKLVDTGTLNPKLLDIKDELKEAKKIFGDFNIEVVSEESIEKQKSLIADLQNSVKGGTGEAGSAIVDSESISRIKELEGEVEDLREDLASARNEAYRLGEDLSTAQAELYEALNNQRTVEDYGANDRVNELEKQVEDLNEKLQTARGTIDIFASELAGAERRLESALEQQKIDISIEPSVEPGEFASKLSEQLTVPAQIEVEGKVSDPKKFAWDVAGAIDYIPLDVTFASITDDAYDELKKELDTVLPSLALEIPVTLANNTTDFAEANQAAADTAKETEENTEGATKEIKAEGEAAKLAAKYKKEFAEANAKVAKASKNTAKNTKEAKKEIEDEGKAAAAHAKAFEDFVKSQQEHDGIITKMGNTLYDDNFSFNKMINFAQNEKFKVKYNPASQIYEVSSELISDYKKLGEAIAKSDAELIQLYADLDEHEARGINNDATLEKLSAETAKNAELVKVWNTMKNDQGQLLGANENNWLKVIRTERQEQAMRNIAEKESIEIAKAHGAAIEENKRRDEQAAKAREQNLQQEQKLERAIAADAEKRAVKADAEREKNLQAEQKMRHALEEKVRRQRETQKQTAAKESADKEASALATQERAYKNILSIKSQIEALKLKDGDHSNELQNLQEQLAIQQKIYGQATLQIKAVNSQYNAYERLKELRKLTAAEAAKAAQKVATAEDSAAKSSQDKLNKAKTDSDKNAQSALSEQNEKAAKAYRDLTKQAKTYYKLLGKESAKALTKTETETLEELKREWADATNGVGKYSIALADTSDSFKNVTMAANDFMRASIASTTQLENKLDGYINKLNTLKANPSRLKGLSLDDVQSLINKINELKNETIDLDTEEARNKVAKLDSEVEAFFDKLSNTAKEISVVNIKDEISDYLNKNTKLSMKFRIELLKLSKELKSGLPDNRLKEIYKRFTEIRIEARETGQEGARSLDTISQRLSDMDSKFIAQLLSWQDIIRYIRTVATTVKELDTALTEMRKVSDESLSSLKAYQGISFDLADQVGTTAVQIQNSTADFMRLGESLEDAAESARVANILMNVSEFETISEATDSLIAMSAAYSDLEKIDIVDKLNEIGNNYAVSTDGLATALQSSASALVTAHNDINEAIALVTAGNLVTQDPNKVGTGLRTISLRLTGTKTAAAELTELGEEVDDMITTQSKLRQTILDATKVASNGYKGFDILDEKGNYKSTYQIMLGLSEIYKEIEEQDKKLGRNNLNLLLETIAGKNRANIAASILQNPQTLMDAFDDSKLNSANSALEENQKYLESIEGHLHKLQNAVQDLFYSLIDSGTINKVLDFATAFINMLDNIVESLGSTGSLVATGGLILFFKNLGPIVSYLIKNVPGLVEDIKELTNNGASFLQVLKNIFPTLAKIGSAIAPYLPAIIAITAAIVAAKVAWDHFNVTVSEKQEEIDKVQSTITDIKSEIEEIQAIENKTDGQKERLALLEDELAIQKDILKTVERQRLLELSGNKFTDYFDKDNWNTKISAFENKNPNTMSSAQRFRNFKFDDVQKEYSELQDTIHQLRKNLDNPRRSVNEHNKDQKDYDKAQSKLDSLERETLENYEQSLQDYADLRTTAQSIEETLSTLSEDDPLYKVLKSLSERYKSQINELEAYIIEVDALLGMESSVTSKERFDTYNKGLIGQLNGKTKAEYDAVWERTKDFTAAERQAWYEATKGAKDGWEAIELYNASLEKSEEKIEEVGNATNSNLISAATTLNKKIKPATDALASLYQELFYGDDNKFDASRLDPAQLAGIKENFITNLTELGIEFEDAEEKVNKFFEALSDPNVDKTKAQNAFNEILTEYFYAADGLSDLTEETADGLKKMLTGLNVTNADEVVDNVLKAKTALQEISKIDFDSKISAAREALASEEQKISDWDLDEYAEKIKNSTIQSKYGNVDMDKRTVIHYNNEILGAFKEGMSSWEQEFDKEGNLVSSYYDEIKRAVINGEDAIDTVFGGTDSFELDNQEIDVAFTPIMVDENGNNPQFLTQGTVRNYIQTVLAKADEEISKSGEEWSEAAVIKKAFEIDLEGLSVDDFDSKGRKIGQKFVHGIIAGIGEDAVDIGSLLHFSGEEGAWQLADDAIAAYTSLKEKAAQGTLDFTELTGQELRVLKNEGIIAGETAQYLAILNLQKQLANGVDISTTQSVKALADLATQAGIDIAELTVLNKVLSLIAKRDEAVAAGVGADAAEYSRQIDALKNNMVAEIQEALGNIQLGLKFAPENTSSAGSAGKDAGDAYVEAFEKELEALEKQRDAGIISETEFLEKYKELIEKYFKDVDGYGEEYAERMADYWDRVTEHMENVVSAIGTLLDKKKDAAEKSKDAAVKALEKEKEAADKYYQSQIDYIDDLVDALEDQKDALQDQIDILQDQIDALQDANDERERAITLQKAQYELQKAQNQRTKLIYKDGQMVYENDTSAVRDAKKAVEDAEFDITIAAIEKQIKLLEDEQEAIDKQIDGYKKQQEALQELLDKSNDYYDNLISKTEEYWDNLIDALDKQKSKWDELVEQKEIAEAFALVQETMKQFGYTVDDVLNDTPGAFEAFKNAYLSTLRDANAGNQNFLDGLNYATSGISTSLSSISTDAEAAAKALEGLGNVKLDDSTEKFKALQDAVTNTTKAVSGGGSSESNQKASEGEGSGEGAGGSALTSAIEGVKTATDNSIGQTSDDTSGSTAISDFNTLTEAIGLVCEKIGVAGENGEAAEDSLLGIIQKLPELAEPALGDEGLKGLFDTLLKSIEGCATAAGNLLSTVELLGHTGMLGMDAPPLKATGNVHIGNAYADGKLGIKKPEEAIVGEAGQELIVDSSTGKYRLTHGPELAKLDKGDLVFNAAQTKEIIKNGMRDDGHSYANGTGTLMPLTTEEMNLFKTMGNALMGIQADMSSIVEPVKSMAQKVTNNTTNIAPTINISGQQFTVQGVTGEAVTRQIQDTFAGLITNAYQRAMT